MTVRRGSPPARFRQNYVPRVEPFTDSIWYGVGADVLAGPREPIWYNAQSEDTLRFVGSVSFAGGGGGLAADPFCDCIPGITAVDLNSVLVRISTYVPDVVVYAAGINDIIAGTDPATVAATISAGLDTAWSLRTGAYYQLVVTTLLRSLNVTYNAGVLAVNALLPAIVASKPYRSHLVLADVYASIPNPTIGVNMHDEIHPNDTGYPYLAAAAWRNGLRAGVARAKT